jgi:hypothetical protein
VHSSSASASAIGSHRLTGDAPQIRAVHRLEQIVGIARLRHVVPPPRIVRARRLSPRQREQPIDRAQRAAAIAVAPRQLAEREQRRLRHRIQLRRLS